MFTPLKLAAGYLIGTYAFFLTAGRAAEVENLSRLTLFVLAAVSALCIGYVAQVQRLKRSRPTAERADGPATPGLVFLCATYFLILGLAQLNVIGVPSPSEVAHALTHPGEQYFLQRQFEGEFSRPVQVLTLLAGFYPLLIPLAVLHWSRLGKLLRCYVITGIAIYVTYYLSIGVLKGLGDLLITWGASYLLLSATRVGGKARHVRIRPWRRAALLTVMTLIFLTYMSFNQNDRTESSGQPSAIPANPVIARIVGDDLASGLAVTLSYPTHGYLGLSYNLSVPFVWTKGIGGSPAIGSYLGQYTSIDPHFDDRYTARTAEATGWPDGMYWSTIFPWLASDLSYPGSLAFMAIVGWFLAKFWIESIRTRRILSVALFGQLALLIAFVPANNQLGQTRPALIAFVSLAALSLADRIRRRVAASAAANEPIRLGPGRHLPRRGSA
ncbi:hypothetical protein [Micromonospora sp. NPDC047740]|uniref:hypothetical protein n=1 Tax=Micromonospora sp. NPDC047740 TaxID=3364254 RepID=UPI0037236207